MGAGSSAQSKVSDLPAPACPLFYNYSPSTQHIPASTLPTRDSRGTVRRPVGGCSARVIALRQLPVVTAEAKRQAKEFLSGVAKMKKAKKGDSAALAKIAEVEAQARTVNDEPSLTPAISSCFLVNIAVDEQGRLAPLSTGGAAGLTDAMQMADGGDTDVVSETASAAPRSQAQSNGRKKGFNFDSAANHNNTNGTSQSQGGNTPPPNGHGHQRKPPAMNIITSSPETGVSTANMGTPPSPKTGSHDSNLPINRLSHKPNNAAGASPTPTPPAPLVGAKAMPTIFAPPPATLSENDDPDVDDTDSSAFLSSSTRSLLIKDSRFRRSDGGGADTAAALNVNLGDPATTRLRRQNSRVALMQVPNRTRWFLFNDSRTHEAQVTVKFCYMGLDEKDRAAAAAAAAAAAGSPAKGDAAAISPSKTTGYLPAPGDMKMMCVPTPLSHKATAPKEVKKQLANMSSSSRSFVEMEPMAAADFREALPAPSSDAQRELMESFDKEVGRMAAVQIFVVLAPGATVFLAEGEATGYVVDTHMVPFNSSNSMAVLGRLLTPDLVRSGKEKAEAMTKGCYRHKLFYVAELKASRSRGGQTGAAAKPAPPPPQSSGANAANPNAFMPDFGTPVELQNGNSTSTAVNNVSASNAAAPPRTTSTTATALPPIKGVSPPPPADSEPMRSADGSPARAPAPPQQHRLSCRSPSTSPSHPQPKATDSNPSSSPDTVPLRKKRIGSMLRNPELTAASQQADDAERKRSFHRDLPSSNSLAISF